MIRMRKKNKKAQVWLSDYTLGMMLFILAALLSVRIIINSFSTNNDFQELKSEASKISEIFLSEGFPADWDNNTVIRPGLLTGKRLDESKVIKAMNSTYINYTRLKPMLQSKHDFLVIFEHPDGDMAEFGELCAIGSPRVAIINDSSPSLDCHNASFSFNYRNMIKLNRIVVYNSSIVRMVVYAWN
jgi:hypothetical protein